MISMPAVRRICASDPFPTNGALELLTGDHAGVDNLVVERPA